MTLWKRAMDYLGLGPEDAYDDYDMPYEPEPPRGPRGPRPYPGGQYANGWEQEPPRGRPRGNWDDEYPPQRPAPTRVSGRDLDPVPPRRPSPMEPSDPSGLTVRPPRNAVTPPAPRQAPSHHQSSSHPGSSSEPFTLRPRRFDQAQELADRFKDGLPVIMNLEGTDREVSRRLIDFASGLCYALGGTMEKVATGVYLLKPTARGGYNDGYAD